jgi:E3 ubiquitin-protein ligase NRDP1
LRLKCDFEPYGCQAVIRLENLPLHRQECEYNPKKPIICKQGCNIIVAKDELKSHNCIKELRKIIDDQQFKINQLSTELMMQKNDLTVYINELRALKV